MLFVKRSTQTFLENAATSKYKKTNKYKATNINTEGAKHEKEPNSINLTKLTAKVIVPWH